MRIHGDHLTNRHIIDAATISRVELDRWLDKGSRSRDHAFDITLQGESRRHQNGGEGKAATWDQWGVFLAYLFAQDSTLTIPRVYEDVHDFNFKTDFRFTSGWPEDAHGDHRFEYAGIPFMQQCKTCSASMRWR